MHHGAAWPSGHLRTRQVHGRTVIAFHGELDIAAAAEVMSRLDAATVGRGRDVVLDLNPGRVPRLLRATDPLPGRTAGPGPRRAPASGLPHPLILRILRAAKLMGRLAPLPTLEDALADTNDRTAR
ncbi:STAS domain-containing protein [Streptomyces sp. GLT-R25]